MAPTPEPVPIELNSLPGVKRDGTVLDGNYHNEAVWCRFQRKRARKIGGYRTLTNLLGGVSRGLHVFDQNNRTYTHSGSATALERFTIDPNGVTSSISDRTPATYTASATNMWQFAAIYDGTGVGMKILAHAAPNLLDISSDTALPVFYGDMTGTGVLTPTNAQNCSGGVFVIHPYVMTLGSNGIVEWSPPNAPNGFGGAGSSSARITDAKLVRGMQLRAGAGNGPSGLIWSLHDLIRVTFVGDTTTFNFDVISDDVSIMSSMCPIEYGGIYYWIGTDTFYMFNGVIREIKNDMNSNFFFDNLNYTYRNKVFAFKVPRFGEIWWCFPKGDATECNWAIVYNVREDFWFDTPLPNGGRSAAQSARVFRTPIMAGVDETSTGSGKYYLWQHEFGVDELRGSEVLAINSYFETANFMMADGGIAPSPVDSAIVCNIIEPDFIQTGDMTVQVVGTSNARSRKYASEPATFPDTATTVQQQVANIRAQIRQARFRYTSNVQGGNYQAGKIMYHIQPGDRVITS